MTWCNILLIIGMVSAYCAGIIVSFFIGWLGFSMAIADMLRLRAVLKRKTHFRGYELLSRRLRMIRRIGFDLLLIPWSIGMFSFGVLVLIDLVRRIISGTVIPHS